MVWSPFTCQLTIIGINMAGQELVRRMMTKSRAWSSGMAKGATLMPLPYHREFAPTTWMKGPVMRLPSTVTSKSCQTRVNMQ